MTNELESVLFADPAILAEFSSHRQLSRFLVFEIALTRALSEVGILDANLADAAVAKMVEFVPELTAIQQAVAIDGLPVPEYVHQLRNHVGEDLRAAVHLGATSQDVLDTALMLALRACNKIYRSRLSALVGQLRQLSQQQGKNPMTGRTRMQAALAIRVADRVETWVAPLEHHDAHLQRLRPELERLQFGGPVGNRAYPTSIAGQGDQIARKLAKSLKLSHAPHAWHSMRGGIADYANWLSLVTGSLGKMGQDLCLMAQQGVDELVLTGGGKSSAMPHKQNPVQAELLVTLARYNAVQVAGMHNAIIHEQERSGAAWSLEWMILPGMANATGKALDVASQLVANIERLGLATEGNESLNDRRDGCCA